MMAAKKKETPPRRSPWLVAVTLIVLVAFAVVIWMLSRGPAQEGTDPMVLPPTPTATATPTPSELPAPSATSTAVQIPPDFERQQAEIAAVPRISIEQAQERLQAGQAIAVDVRSMDAFQTEHLPGAVPAPEEQVPQVVAHLPRNALIITYCA